MDTYLETILFYGAVHAPVGAITAFIAGGKAAGTLGTSCLWNIFFDGNEYSRRRFISKRIGSI